MYRILGRDPLKSPLTAMEQALFERAITVLLEQEYSSPQQASND